MQLFACRGVAIALPLILSVLVLSGCSFSDAPQQAPAPSASTAAAEKSDTPTPMDTFRALAPAEGMKFTSLFSEPVSDADARIDRLEKSVQSLRNDFDTVVPSMVRLVAIEKDMRELVGQLKTLTNPAEVSSEPMPLPPVMSDVSPVTPETSALKAQNKIPDEEVAGGTEEIPANKTSSVTPEAAPQGQLPPKGAASPSSPVVKKDAAPPAPSTQPPPLPVTKEPPVVTPPVAAEPAAHSAPAPSVPKETAPKVPEQKAPEQKIPEQKPAEVLPKAMTPVTPAKKAETAAPEKPAAATAHLGTVKAVRVADHSDKTRIVLDMTSVVKFKASLDEKGKTLIIDLPDLDFTPKKTWDALSADLIAGYRYENGKLYLDAIYPSVIKSQQMLPPSEGMGYRLVIDLFSEQVHKKK